MFFWLFESCHKSCLSCCCNKCHSYILYFPYLKIFYRVDFCWILSFFIGCVIYCGDVFLFNRNYLLVCLGQVRVFVFIWNIRRICVIFAMGCSLLIELSTVSNYSAVQNVKELLSNQCIHHRLKGSLRY